MFDCRVECIFWIEGLFKQQAQTFVFLRFVILRDMNMLVILEIKTMIQITKKPYYDILRSM